MNQLFVEVLLTVVTVAISAVGGYASKYLNKKGHKVAAEESLALTKEAENAIKNNQALAENVVRAVEKRFGGESAIVKFDKAVGFLINDANQHGISISKDNALSLIEGALKKLEDEVGSAWSTSKPVQPVQQ